MKSLLLLLLLVLLLLHESESATDNPIGVNYGTRGNNLPPPSQVVELLKNTNIGKVKLYDANPAILRAFAGTSFDITVGIPNEQIPSLVDQGAALSWMRQNVVTYLPDTRIRGIAVGNEVLAGKNSNQQLAAQLVPAMNSLQSALVTLKLNDLIKITAPQSLATLSTSFPPSSGTFRPDLAQSALVPLLTFLQATNSTFMVNAYPFMAYRSNPRDVSLAYCLFLPNSGVTDPGTQFLYSNMFGAMLDAVISAMKKLRFPDVRIGVSETGWPSLGDPSEAEVSLRNAMLYNRNLVFYISSSPGTPLRPKQQIDTYIFSLYNENLKEGPASERNYGLFRPDGSTVYDVGILKSGSVITPPSPFVSPNPPTPVTIPITPPPPPPPSRPPFATPPSPVTTPTPPSVGAPPAPVTYPSPTPPSVGAPPAPVTYPPPTPPSVGAPPAPVTYPSPMTPSFPKPPPSPVTFPAPMIPPSPVIVYPAPMTPPTPPYSGTPSTPSGGHGAPVWCVAKPNADATSLAAALGFACGEGGADCLAIQPGGACYYPNDVTSHASYAFNSYYQRHGRNYWNCDFRNNAVVAISDPSYGGCNYPAK
ncbi:glucan endo-1,3-beta-D-glucosidase isoform X2 [Selaginella moellendorffii]|nr:glucan endo-1,3-beta-D-glucosidase isoform X2 [Selaginella moellendorffii]|eukprot:XP_002987316.2 glucan endo-1,3-beta-D-glucosidase isoform X2 [Selaginella moellendorffii]